MGGQQLMASPPVRQDMEARAVEPCPQPVERPISPPAMATSHNLSCCPWGHVLTRQLQPFLYGRFSASRAALVLMEEGVSASSLATTCRAGGTGHRHVLMGC